MREMGVAGEPAGDSPAGDGRTIQPHAMLLVLDRTAIRVAGASANAAAWLGGDPAASLIDRPIDALIDPDSLARLRLTLDSGPLAQPFPVGAIARGDGRLLGSGLAHRLAGHPLLEIEAPVGEESLEAVPVGWLDALLADGPRIRPEDGGDLVAELAAAAERLRGITGFDRVSVHRFTHDWNVELLAESGAPSIRGMAERVFPADEVDGLWSRMFGLHWVRTIADVDAGPVPVELPPALADDPMALAHVAARAPLASHEEYLRRLGVRSATVLVLSNAGKAWGMIACHAIDTPRRPSLIRRVALAALARALSHRIAAHEAAARQRHREHIRERLATPIAALGSSEELTAVLSRHAGALMQGLSATGMAICIGATVECHGHTPPDAAIRELAQWLTAGRPAVCATERLATLFAPMADHEACAAGMLAIRLSRVSADFVMWFRPGKPRLSRPGASRQELGESAPWSSDERDAASELRRAVLDILVERSVRVSRRAMMLTRDNQALVSADQRKDAFIAMLGHELRGPLSALEYGIASLHGARDDGSATPPEVLDILRRQVRQMSALVEDIVDIARIRHNRLELRRRPLRVADILRDAVDANAAALERADQGIEVSCADDTMRIMADPMRMTQILTNLLANAIRHAHSSRPIELVARRDGEYALVAVRDHGPGLSPEMQHTIFDAFSAPTGDAESSRVGLGLGLSLVRSLVEAHAGTIEVTSEGTGHGSCFTLRLPLADTEPAAEPGEGRTAGNRQLAPTAAPRRILIVDDDADSAVALAVLMRTYGHQARKAHDGATALAVLASYDADVVTIDQNLPDIDGASLAREIRARSSRPPRLICISGETPAEHSGASVFDQVLVKPVDPQSLLALVGRTDAPAPGAH
ncbi:MAG: ATP-binding protein [Pseudomonadota bacterium]|nr:ATP-binding protein [Pseudomonadota bacterium]